MFFYFYDLKNQTMKHKLKILISSVGSLVGTNLLDVLESQYCYRRDLVYLIGTNSIANSINNFKCDKCYLMPTTATPDFTRRMTDILRKEKPDLILNGRDEDAEAIALILMDNPDLKAKLPYGKLHTIRYALNKWETWLFTQKYSLPFANTFVRDKSGGVSELKSFAEEAGYPMIAKPVEGFASIGVFFIRNWQEAEYAFSLEDYLIQEYLGKPDAMDDYFRMMDGPTPLFANAPDVYHHTATTFISRNGSISKVFTSKNVHKNGATIEFHKLYIEELEALGLAYAKAIYQEGGYGPLGAQFKLDRNNNWKAQEMNMRANGNTYPRFLMGQDDVGLIVNEFFPDFDFPQYQPDEKEVGFFIGKTLTASKLSIEDLKGLENRKVWEFIRDAPRR
jgi:hypothetical protein